VVFLWFHKLQLFSAMRYLHILQVCPTAVTEAKPCGRVCAMQNTSDPKVNFYETNAASVRACARVRVCVCVKSHQC